MSKRISAIILVAACLFIATRSSAATVGAWAVELDYGRLTFSGVPVIFDFGPPLTWSSSYALGDWDYAYAIVDTSATGATFFPGATAAAHTSSESLAAEIQASGLAPTLPNRNMSLLASANRSFRFFAQQAGDLTVSIPYRIVENVVVDPLQGFVISDVSAELELARSLVDDVTVLWTVDSQRLGNTLHAGENISLERAGVLAATVSFDDTVRWGFVRVGGVDQVELKAVTEPTSSVVLLASAVLALVLCRRARRSHRA